MPNPVLKNQYHQQVVLVDAIAASGTVSTGIDLQSYTFLGLATDANWTTSDISFKVQIDNSGTWIPVFIAAGTAYKLTGIVASSYVIVPLGNFPNVRGLQVVSTTTQTSATNLSIVAGNP